MSTSLGALLIALQARPASAESEELHRRAHAKGPCAVEDLTLIELFFRDAALSFATAILSGVLPRPISIGRGCHEKVAATLQTFRWKSDFDVRSAEHPYHPIWQNFASWCQASGLEPKLDGTPGAKEPAYVLFVEANR
ncbi:hypothetical protein ISN76_10110 [Dyella halodurans]|uniref:Uncharacterized protein n=1 Tax=Dyella halodurans TaxID=1920171 RepID=A0ABV9C2F2_9GAMM|nr:hypothetical protein [Dyella halodurans]